MTGNIEMTMKDWKEENNCLTKDFTFGDFSEAFSFMTQVAIAAEKADHHPEWTNVWNRVSFRLSTHDAGDIVTDKDRALAADIDRIAEKYS